MGARSGLRNQKRGLSVRPHRLRRNATLLRSQKIAREIRQHSGFRLRLQDRSGKLKENRSGNHSF